MINTWVWYNSQGLQSQNIAKGCTDQGVDCWKPNKEIQIMPPLLKTLDLLHSLNIFAMIFAFLCMFKWAYPWFWRGQKFNATKFDVLTLYFLLAPLVVVSKLSYQYRDMTESWLSRFFWTIEIKPRFSNYHTILRR